MTREASARLTASLSTLDEGPTGSVAVLPC